MGQITVCVTGVGGPAGFNCLRSLHECELDLRMIALDMDRGAAGLYYKADSAYVVPAARSEEFLLTLIKILKKEEVDVLIPTVDEEIAAICRTSVLEQLSQVVSFLLPPEGAAMRALDKYSTIFEARRAGLGAPKTLVVRQPSEMAQKAREIGFPLVAKPSRSRGARGVSYARAEADLAEAWKLASAEGGEVLFQEYIPGPVYTVGAVADRDREIAASVVLKKTKEIPPTGGVAVAGVTVENKELQSLGERYVSCLEWIGPASAEIKQDERDGAYKLMEVNPRLFGYNYLASAAGVNLAEVTVRLALGENVEPAKTYTAGLSFVRAPYDLIIQEEVR